MSVDYKLIGTRIKEKRKQKKLTQENLAESLDVSVGYVSQVERGATKISLDLLAEIASVLECDIAFFVEESAIKSKYYMTETIYYAFEGLNEKEKRIILGIIGILKENRIILS